MTCFSHVSEFQLGPWVHKYGWKDEGQEIFITSQDENIKTKNITESIGFDSMLLNYIYIHFFHVQLFPKISLWYYEFVLDC